MQLLLIPLDIAENIQALDFPTRRKRSKKYRTHEVFPSKPSFIQFSSLIFPSKHLNTATFLLRFMVNL